MNQRVRMPGVLIAAMLATLNTGCMVLAVESNATRRIDDTPLIEERAKLDCDGIDRGPGHGVSLGHLTKQQIETAWGEPDAIKAVNGRELWFYKTNLRWNGVWGIFVVVPIPLLVPTGREHLVIEFSGESAQSVEAHYQVGRAYGCGFVPIHGGGWGCSDGQPDDYYGLHSAFCGHGKKLSEPEGT